jgi:vitamin B12/bleomycin/antimicrobial peptide transport system ATP-binding/permease protein
MVGIVRNPLAAPAAFPPAQGWIARERSWPRLRHGLWLLGRYFFSSEAKIAWPLLLLAIAIQFGSVYTMLLSNRFEKILFDVIGNHQGSRLPMVMAGYVAVACMVSIVAAVGEYLRGVLTIRWRRWLAEDYAGRWLDRSRFYTIERGTLVENPDQRMSDDVRIFVEGALLFSLGLLQVTVSVISFSVVLWHLSQPIDLTRLGIALRIPGDMVWYSVLYTALCTFLLFRFGKPLIRRNMAQQHYEADYRYSLVQLRRNAEQIALARLGHAEWQRLRALYQSIKRNFMGLILVKQVIAVVTQVALNFKSLLPIMITAPQYFAGLLTMGDVMQARSAFIQLSGALSWPIQSYATFAETLSALNRLYLLDQMIERPEHHGVHVTQDEDPAIHVCALRLALPDGRPLAPVGDWTIAPGTRWVVRGRSGVGKSTLLRAIAGIWPEGQGEIRLPRAARVMIVPQRAYLGNGSLRSILSFPAEPSVFSAQDCRAALERAGLAGFAGQVEDSAPWSETMSPGEQQRLGFARVLLHRPTHLFLDEATSALDPETARDCYRLLDDLSGLTLVSIVHSPLLDAFHDSGIEIGGAQGPHPFLLQSQRDNPNS